jgi:aspartate kinase
MISQTIDKNNALVLSFSIEEEDVSSLEQVISDSDLFNEFKLSIRTGLVKISLVGVGMASNFGVAAKAFTLLQEAGVSYHTVSTSEISISCTIDEEKKQAAVEALSVGFRL